MAVSFRRPIPLHVDTESEAESMSIQLQTPVSSTSQTNMDSLQPAAVNTPNTTPGSARSRQNPARQSLTVNTEDTSRGVVAFTESGTFKYADWFQINSNGFVITDQKMRNIPSAPVDTEPPELKRPKPGDSIPSCTSTVESIPEAELLSPSTSDVSMGGMTPKSMPVSMSISDFQIPVAPPTSFPLVTVRSLTDIRTQENVGRGSSGSVQKVKHIPTGLTLALKTVPIDLDEKKSKQVVTELKMLHESQSPFIVSFYGAFYKDGAFSLLLEYMDAGSLLDLLKLVGKVPEHVLQLITKQVLHGLMYLHKVRRIIHRDIKPSNILLSKQGVAKIADFGVSGELTGTDNTRHSFVGTVTYMSPERIQGQDYSFDSDLWSLGLALTECATGRFPYLPPTPENKDGRERKLNFWDIMDKIVLQEPPILPADSFSDSFRDFLSKCLQKNCAGRWSTKDLLDHPWIKDCRMTEEELAVWISEALRRTPTVQPVPQMGLFLGMPTPDQNGSSSNKQLSSKKRTLEE